MADEQEYIRELTKKELDDLLGSFATVFCLEVIKLAMNNKLEKEDEYNK